MNGYEYLVRRNRLMIKLTDDMAGLAALAETARDQETRRLQARFDIELGELYAGAAAEFPGERRKKARPLVDPR